MAERSRDRSSSNESQPKFPECSHFRRRNDNHRRCQQCRLNVGLPLCTQDSPCLVCQDWLPEAWTAHAKATAQRNRRKATAAAQAARKETEMMDDSMELHAPRHAFPTNRPKSEESSKTKRSKTVASSSQPKSDHVPHSPDPRQWSPQHGMSLPSTLMQHWTWIPREHFRRTRMLRATGRRFRLRNVIPSGKRSLLPGERSRSTLPRLRELKGPLCWTWVRQRFLTECPGWTSRLSRTPWRPRHG